MVTRPDPPDPALLNQALAHVRTGQPAAAERLLAADVVEIERERKGKVSVDDVRPLIVDLRRDSPTYLGYFGVTLTPVARNMLYVPEGFAHGFLTVDGALPDVTIGAEVFPAATATGCSPPATRSPISTTTPSRE